MPNERRPMLRSSNVAQNQRETRPHVQARNCRSNRIPKQNLHLAYGTVVQLDNNWIGQVPQPSFPSHDGVAAMALMKTKKNARHLTHPCLLSCLNSSPHEGVLVDRRGPHERPATGS